MTEKTKYIIRRVAKFTLTSPIWSFLFLIGGISWTIGFVGQVVKGIGMSLMSGSDSLDALLMRTFASPGSWCDKVAEWANK